ncbi:MAG: asparaginase, partial [Sulfurospirillum sp.]|nr:asparaginase [Sulfurospirillum sp.]
MAIVAKVYRGSIVDLTHIAHVAVVNHAGELLHSVGDPKRVTFIRSSAKMVQALASLESGAVDAYGLSEQELALLCASHNGEEIHTSTAANILQKAGLGIQHLQCGIHPSFNSFVAKELEEKGVTLNASHNNCSGKHSGMLIAANYKKEDLSNYLSINHPVQQRILQTLSEVCAYPKEQIVIATDGCGVPVHAL